METSTSQSIIHPWNVNNTRTPISKLWSAKNNVLKKPVLQQDESPTTTDSMTSECSDSDNEHDNDNNIQKGNSPLSPISLINNNNNEDENNDVIRGSKSDNDKGEEDDGDEDNVIAISQHVRNVVANLASYDNTNADWAMPRWKELENKRLALCQKRVHLERRLFEFSKNQLGSAGQVQLQNNNNNNIKNNDLSNSSATTSQSSISSNSNKYIDINDNIKLRRYVLKKGQDPVLWSGSTNRKNVPEGLGRMIFSDGQIYEGEIKNGQREGNGVNVWPNGQVYTGSWNCNSRSGRGTHRWIDGRTVTGPWLNGHLHGRVFFTWPDGATYDGDTVKGQKEGRGIHTWKDGRVYSGQYNNGSENGFGTLTEEGQHTKYRGQFKNGKRNGYGIQIWKNKTYDGEWYQNMIHGRGKLIWLSGACYTGEFYNGKYNGNGSYRSESGTKFVGQWLNGYKHGQGKQYWSDGKIYNGNFINNKRTGYGRMIYSDGTIYSGGFINGKRNGQGIEICIIINEINGEQINDIRHCGLWKNDIPIIEDKKKINSKSIIDQSIDDLYFLKPKSILLDENEQIIRIVSVASTSGSGSFGSDSIPSYQNIIFHD